MDRDFLIGRFGVLFGSGEPTLFFSPGRVNLIGEHIDYNGGKVFPCALTLGIYAAARQNGTGSIRLFSENFPETGVITVPLDAIEKTQTWADYPLGVFLLMQEALNAPLSGMDIFFFGDLPDGAGLSSSAAIGVLSCVVAKTLCAVTLEDVPQLCRQAENRFNGVNCGIMDQFAVYMGRRNTAICLDTRTLSYTYVPLELGDYLIAVCSSSKKRALADSKYNQRRAECELALSQLRKVREIDFLCELTPEDFEQLQTAIVDETARKRARHAVTENARTESAVLALQAGDLPRFGALMCLSHCSLRDDYAVTGEELDTLFSLAMETEGVLGSRMTGAGFGGSTVSLVHKDAFARFEAHIRQGYFDKFSYYPDVFAAKPGDGTGLLEATW